MGDTAPDHFASISRQTPMTPSMFDRLHSTRAETGEGTAWPGSFSAPRARHDGGASTRQLLAYGQPVHRYTDHWAGPPLATDASVQKTSPGAAFQALDWEWIIIW